MQGVWLLMPPSTLNSPIVFREKFLQAKFGMRAAGFVTSFDCDELTGQSSWNLLLPCSYLLHLDGALSFCRRTQRLNIFHRGNQCPALRLCRVSCPPLLVFMPTLACFLALPPTFLNQQLFESCTLELGEGQGV